MTGNLARDHYPALPEVDRDIFALPSLTGFTPRVSLTLVWVKRIANWGQPQLSNCIR
jgi:hypothetical protein